MAIVETGSFADFIVVDGLLLVQGGLVGAGMRERVNRRARP